MTAEQIEDFLYDLDDRCDESTGIALQMIHASKGLQKLVEALPDEELYEITDMEPICGPDEIVLSDGLLVRFDIETERIVAWAKMEPWPTAPE